MAGTALNLDQIEQLLASSRTRGEYEDYLRDFIAGPNVGIEVDLTSGTLAGKDAKNVYTGFNNARKKMDADTGKPAVEGGAQVQVILKQVDMVDADGNVIPETDENGNPVKDEKGNTVVKKEGHIFLINKAKYQVPGSDATPVADEPAPEPVEA